MRLGKYGRHSVSKKYWAMVYDDSNPNDIEHVIANVSQEEVKEFFSYCGIEEANIVYDNEVRGK